MSRTTRQRWLSSARTILDKAWTKRRPSRDQSPLTRLLRIESLEDRSLLSITVNTLVDEADGSIVDGDISLRDAIAASPAGGVINFSVTGTINLALGEVVVQDRILEGPGAAQLTINANLLSRVFTTRGTTTLAGMTITGGKHVGSGGGGGISNETSVGAEGILTVRDSIVTGNSAGRGGGIYTGGYVDASSTLTVVNSTISGNNTLDANPPNGRGGGIYGRYALVRVDKSTISGNVAADRGGGIYGLAVKVTNSTVTGNTADFGAGIFGRGTIANSTISGNDDLHGAIYLQSGLVANSTITDNEIGIQGSCVVANSTITDNFFGVYAFGTTTLTNSIIAGNDWDIVGAVDVAASRNNLIGSNRQFDPIGLPAGGLTDGVNGNLVGVPNLGLGPLADNGGPTKTHALWSFSPGVNRGDNTLIPIDPSTGLPFTTDQTGAARIFNGGTVDIGAVELQATPFVSTVVNTAADDVAPNALTSLREAVGFAPLLGGAVTFDPTVFATPQTIALVHGQVTVDGTSVPVTISGPGAVLATVDAGGATGIFDSYGTTTISGLKVTGGGGAGFDAAIKNNSGTLSIQHSVISGNAITGVLNFGLGTNLGTLTVSNSTFLDNHGIGKYGGAIQNGIETYHYGTVTISNSTISGNSADEGGGIHNLDMLTISNSTISGNSAKYGGGIWGGGTIANSTISGNSANKAGGGILGGGTISNSTISGNSAGTGGGGIYTRVPLTIANSTISGNSANQNGGGIFDGGTLTISNSTISGNSAAFSGGGVFVDDDDLTIVNSIVAGNDNGGSLPTDLLVGVDGTVNGAYNLIGDAATAGGLMNGVNGNIVGANPLLVLGPLAGNGGLTMTHALLAGSPAIDAGDPAAVAGVGNIRPYDQRGEPFTRVLDGDGIGGLRIDIGAFEAPTVPPQLPGDYNLDGNVDAADYVFWRKVLGTNVGPPYVGADGDGDGVIGPGDYNVWRAHFGESLPPGAASGAQVASAEGASDVAAVRRTAPANVVEPSRVDPLAQDYRPAAMPMTSNEGSATSPSLPKPGAGPDLVWFADAESSPQIRPEHDAAAARERSAALPRDTALLAWLSAPRYRESLLAQDIGPHSKEDLSPIDDSESNSIDEIFAGLATARLLDF